MSRPKPNPIDPASPRASEFLSALAPADLQEAGWRGQGRSTIASTTARSGRFRRAFFRARMGPRASGVTGAARG